MPAQTTKLNQIEARVELFNRDNENSEGYLYGDVGETWWGGGITATKVRYMLETAKSEIVDIHVNSDGGDVVEGIAICNTLRNSNKESHIYIDARAASAASYMILGASKVYMYDNTQLMLHKPWTFTYGNATDLRKLADVLDKHEESMIATYMARFKGTEEELCALLEEETYLTAQEAHDLGFCDEVIDFSQKPSNPQNNANVKQQLLSKYGGNNVAVSSNERPQNENVMYKFLNTLGGK